MSIGDKISNVLVSVAGFLLGGGKPGKNQRMLALQPPAAKTGKPAPSTPYDLARTYLGEKELPGKSLNNPKILAWLRRLMPDADADEISWCSAFVDAMAAQTGHEQARKLTARSWLSVGEPIPAAMARPGDVIIFWRESEDSWKGHVAFFQEWQGSRVRVLGGNQSNAVTSAHYPRSQVLGIRRLRRLPNVHA
jgi:uncharacterized protein (TIGR02594 family)